MGVRGRAAVIHTRNTKDSVYIQTEGVSCRDEAALVTCSCDMTYGPLGTHIINLLHECASLHVQTNCTNTAHFTHGY